MFSATSDRGGGKGGGIFGICSIISTGGLYSAIASAADTCSFIVSTFACSITDSFGIFAVKSAVVVTVSGTAVGLGIETADTGSADTDGDEVFEGFSGKMSGDRVYIGCSGSASSCLTNAFSKGDNIG